MSEREESGVGTNHDAPIPEDVIERAPRAWESDLESYTPMLRGEALEDASRALAASGLPARVAELEAALAPFAALAKVIDALRHEPGSTCLHRLAADDIRRARAALNAKGAE